MKVLQPDYYEEFKCIADKCKDTCCRGWKIEIDKKTFLKYKKVKGEFGNALNKTIRRYRNGQNNDKKYGEFIKTEDEKCYFLNESNLCGIYINLGPEFMCETCAMYPRIVNKYRIDKNETLIEKKLTLSCPEIARTLVNNIEQLTFVMKNEVVDAITTEYILNDKLSRELYYLLWEGRSFSIEIAQFNEIPVWKRLVFIKITEERLQKLIDSKKFTEANDIIENLRNEITKEQIIDSLDNIGKVNNIVKINLISSVIQERMNKGIRNATFLKMIGNVRGLIKDKNTEGFQLRLEEKQMQFNKYFENREYILENYIVYNLYVMYMNALKTKDLNKEITMLMISYSVIKLFLLSTWLKNNGELNDEEIIDVLYSFSREMEHNEIFVESLYKEIKSGGYDSIGYLVTMIY